MKELLHSNITVKVCWKSDLLLWNAIECSSILLVYFKWILKFQNAIFLVELVISGVTSCFTIVFLTCLPEEIFEVWVSILFLF